MRVRIGTASALTLLVPLAMACDRFPGEPEISGSPAVGQAPDLNQAAPGPPAHATVRFGRADQGTDFFPPGSHDASFHAKDAIRPRTTVISAGGTVTFEIAMFHKIAIYQPGVAPEDIDTNSLEPASLPFEFPPLVNDPTSRIVRGPLVFPGPVLSFDWTFDAPGRYLVICEVFPHFTAAKMYAWILVK